MTFVANENIITVIIRGQWLLSPNQPRSSPKMPNSALPDNTGYFGNTVTTGEVIVATGILNL